MMAQQRHADPAPLPGAAAHHFLPPLAPPPLPPGFERWLYTPEELASSPSALEGFSRAEEEAAHRDTLNFFLSFCDLFATGGQREVVGTSMLLYHRFYARRSLKAHDRLEVATACVMLAAKVRNRPMFADEFVKRLMVRRDRRLHPAAINKASEAFVLAKGAVVAAERVVLVACEFDFASLLLPYDVVHHVCGVLHLGEEFERLAGKAVTTMVTRQALMLSHDPFALGHAAVVMAAKLSRLQLPAAAFTPPHPAPGAGAAAAAAAAEDTGQGSAPPSSSSSSSSAATQALIFTPLPVLNSIILSINPSLGGGDGALHGCGGSSSLGAGSGLASSSGPNTVMLATEAGGASSSSSSTSGPSSAAHVAHGAPQGASPGSVAS